MNVPFFHQSSSVQPAQASVCSNPAEQVRSAIFSAKIEQNPEPDDHVRHPQKLRQFAVTAASALIALVGIMSSAVVLSCLSFYPIPSKQMLALFLVMFMLACRTTLAILMRHSMEACSSLARSAWISIHSIDLVSQLAIVLVASKVFCAYHDIFSEVENGPSLISAQEFWIDLSVVAALALAAAACAFSWIQLINDRRLNRVATTL